MKYRHSAGRMDPAEELPSILWGLDPIFSAFARLYITDILHMRESCQVPDIYFYKSHPIHYVDVLGTVVYKREREDFICYGVDDGTGVINCLCWKNDPMKEEVDSDKYKVNDPVMAVQIEWMIEVLQVYREFYDKPLHLQTNTTNESSISSQSEAKNIIKDFLEQRCVSKFRPYDVQDLLQPLIASCTETAPADQEPVEGPAACQQLSMLLKEALQILQDEGIVYRGVESQDKVYFVTTQDKYLFMAVKDIIREDSKREKYQEKGCHILHILSSVRQRHSMNVSKAALELVLKSLECNSDIVSTRNNYFTMF
ncbi:CST complex subunit STN1 isoform X4 [Phyllopteryx taeniolatus]|uniref:CST complex subunit STN1 isoform X4 n=1 Tax=Phyllopteryx taeniolatus TaxID=161469 RepID=UPI002AD389ED|nr:CST complex subunit STN1 isoform X4 [Phyllopteryx taeniolatus]